MSKRSPKLKIAELLELFGKSPEKAFRQVISSSIYFRHPKSSTFWLDYSSLDVESLSKLFSESVPVFNNMDWLKLFHDLDEFYSNEKLAKVNEVIALNPSAKDLITALYLCLELGNTSDNLSNFPAYTDESLAALKSVLRNILPRLTADNQTSYSPHLVQLSNTLIKIQMDMDLLAEFVDAFVWADFEMNQLEGKPGFLLSIPEGQSKSENLYVLNELKTAFKRAYKSLESQPKISDEEHFKKIDPELKTNEGLAVAFEISEAKLTSMTPGTTVLNAEHLDISGLSSNNPDEYSKAVANIQALQLEQLFHHQYRHALAQLYQPNDEIDIHAMCIEFENGFLVTLYELMCSMACFIAQSDVYRYLSEIPGSGSISSIKKSLINQNSQVYPQYSINELHGISNLQIIDQYPVISAKTDNISFPFVTEAGLLNIFNKIEELREKSSSQLHSIIELFSGISFPLSHNPIYKINNQYFFSLQSCQFELNRKLYDYYVSKKLFSLNNKSKEEQGEVSNKGNLRSSAFGKSLKLIFERLTPFVAYDIKFGGKENDLMFGDLSGDIDVLAYFHEENILMPIQIKLSNVVRNNVKSRSQWVNTNIVATGSHQVMKDVKLLKLKAGLKFVSNILDSNIQSENLTIYPLIITDNFYADHKSFNYDDEGNDVLCISYFELKHLILNQAIHKHQNLPEIKGMNAGSQIIMAIENNLFWKFLEDEAVNYTHTKSLSAINDEFKIIMKI